MISSPVSAQSFKPLVSVLVPLTAAAALGVFLGLDQQMAALALVGLVLVPLALSELSLAGWCALLLVTAVATRAPVQVLGLPTALNFLHYPFAVAFAAAAALRPRTAVPNPRIQPGIWILGLVSVTAMSMAGNLSSPLRALIFLVILGQPLLIIWAIWRWGPEPAAGRAVAAWAIALLIVQLPIAAYQGVTLGLSDFIEGTLLGAGASQHLLGALNALAVLVLIAAMLAHKVSTTKGVLGVAIGIGMVIVTYSIQVALALAAALVAVALIRAPVSPRDQRSPGGLRLMGVVFAIVMAGLVPILAELASPGILSRARNLASPGELPETELLAEEASTGPRALLLGSGPGTTGSRAGILLTPELMKEGSPLEFLNLPPTEAAVEIVGSSREVRKGSAESFASSAYGLLGDTGVLGFGAMTFLFFAIHRAVGRSGSWLAPAVRGALVMTYILNFIDNWIEYPEFTVALAVLIGFALLDNTALRGPAESDLPQP